MNENEGSAVDAVHPERPAMLAELVESWRQVADDFESAQDPADHSRYMEAATNCLRDCADALAAALPSPPVAPQAAVDVTAPPEWDALERWLADETGEVLGAVEGALFSVAMDRGRGEKVSDQAESVRVLHALRRLAAARRAAGEADR